MNIMESLNFNGYFPPKAVEEIPETHGIYAAFAGTLGENNTCDMKRLVYIGKAEGTNHLKKRIYEHINDCDSSNSGKQSYWEKNYCEEGEMIFYVYAEHEENLEDIEAALIYKNQPLANILCKDKYTGKACTLCVNCRGDKGTLLDYVSVFRKIQGSL